MTYTGDDVRAALRKFVRDEMHLMGNFSARVVEITDDEEYCTLEPLDGGALFYKVKLKPCIDGIMQGIIPIPEVDSIVWAGHLENVNDVVVLRCSKIQKYILSTPEGDIEITAEKITMQGDTDIAGNVKIAGDFETQGQVEFNEGLNGGMVIVAPLVVKMNAAEVKLNQLMTDVAALFTALLPGSSPISVAPPIVNTTALELTNPNVTH